MGRKTPAQRSLEYLRNLGYTCEVTERWNAAARRRNDLFGFVDILAIKCNATLAVQTTTASNVAARIRKIRGHKNFYPVIAAGWRVEVHGWRPDGTVRIVPVDIAQSADDRRWDVV